MWTDPVDGAAPDESDTGGRRFAAIYERWFRQVHRWIGALGGPGIEADDLAQEVFIVVHRKLDGFDGVNVAGWLYRIAQLTVRDYRQRAWFRRVSWKEREGTVEEAVSELEQPDEQLEGKKRERYFYGLVTRLNPRWRESFVLFEVVGLSGREIAALQGIPAATVRTHLARARREMADLAVKHR